MAKVRITAEVLLLPFGDTDEQANLICSGVDVMGPAVESPPRGTSYVLDWRIG